MQILQLGRAQGKTTFLIDILFHATNDAMVVHNIAEARRLQQDYPEIADRIFAVSNATNGLLRGRRFDRVHIDNLDLVLPYLLGTGPLGIITTTEG